MAFVLLTAGIAGVGSDRQLVLWTKISDSADCTESGCGCHWGRAFHWRGDSLSTTEHRPAGAQQVMDPYHLLLLGFAEHADIVGTEHGHGGTGSDSADVGEQEWLVVSMQHGWNHGDC